MYDITAEEIKGNNLPSNRDVDLTYATSSLEPPVHPANTNVLTSIMERKQVQETPAQQTADRGQ